MPVSIRKVNGFRVSTPRGVKAKRTSRIKAKRQARLLRGVEHGFRPTGKPAQNPDSSIFTPGTIKTLRHTEVSVRPEGNTNEKSETRPSMVDVAGGDPFVPSGHKMIARGRDAVSLNPSSPNRTEKTTFTEGTKKVGIRT